MASGFSTNGTDLDSVFAPLHSGWPQASPVEYDVGGVDLNLRYAPLSTGSAAAATEYDVATTDLNAIFAALGSTGVQVGTQPSNVSGTSAAGRPSGTVTSNAASCAGAKGGGSYTYTWTTSGCTATSPNSSSTTFSATVNAASTDNATAFCTISDGVTSVNTITISVTLQNTTTAGDNLSLGVGTGGSGGSNGYAAGGFGSLIPNTLSDGSIVQELAVGLMTSASPHQLVFSINNYPGTITQAYLTSLSINGTVHMPSDSNFTSFSGGAHGGTAQWIWSAVAIPTNGTTVPIVVIH